MRIVVFGMGNIGRQIAREATARGHEVTAVVRDPATFDSGGDKLSVVKGDAMDPESVAKVARGADVIVNAISPRPSPHGLPASSLATAARALAAGARQAGVTRLVIVGGAGTLEVAPGKRLMDTAAFPPAYKPEAQAGAEALEVYRSQGAGLDWTYISPAAEIGPGERTGHYRSAGDQLLTDSAGKSHISIADYALALVDEIERGTHPRQRISVAY